ncbi:berberine bridge enzyme-like protein 26 [Populus alba x Populus x berolinensis]|nr:berberine bridge enzyme-like protein 26 [Populus alba x Populus x berolinensis]
MFKLRSIDVDVASETAWIQVGATLGEVYYRVSEKSKAHGFSASVEPTVGVGGHFGGGGYGNMMRKYGLSVDNIIDAKMVDVNGRLLDRKSMGEDLFWAITGGGGSSFGVVLAYKINIVRVPEVVTVFLVRRTVEQNATDIVEQWQQVAYNIDDDLFIRLTMNVVNITTRIVEKTVRSTFRALFLGESERLLSIMNASFPKLGLLRSDCIEMSWIESVLFWTDLPLGTTDALLSRTPQSRVHFKRKSDYVQKPIPRDGLEGIWKRAGNLWKIQYATDWNESGQEVANHYIDLTRQLYSYMTPFVSKNPRQAFLNYRDLDLGINHNGKESYLEGRVYGIKYFQENFKRLVKIKTKVDPGNFFRNEQSIPTFPYRKK